MPQNFLCPQRDQPLLLPVDMREWLQEDDLAFVVLDDGRRQQGRHRRRPERPGGDQHVRGDLYIADTGNNRIQMVAAATGTAEWNISSTTAGFVYSVAGSPAGTAGNSGDGGAAASALLDDPQGVKVSGNGLYIADTINCQVREVAKTTGTQWGASNLLIGDDHLHRRRPAPGEGGAWAFVQRSAGAPGGRAGGRWLGGGRGGWPPWPRRVPGLSIATVSLAMRP